MQTIASIRILEKEPNKRGDLFGRLMDDFFLSLGYDHARLNIQKAGREIDIDALHRTEKKRVIAECKAKKDKVGGDEVNKFVGTLDAEKRKEKENQIIGYYISISGFKETAIEQEKDAGGDRLILIDGERVIKELVHGRIIVSKEKAMERAGRCAAVHPDLKVEENIELLAHKIAWIWVVYFTKNKQRKNFALIHADGDNISKTLADEIIKSDREVRGKLHTLTYISPLEEKITEKQINEVKEKYFKYLAGECGEITLEGLPADQEVGYRQLKLENIFVPLYLELSIEYKKGLSLLIKEETQKEEQGKREPVGKILSKCSRLAILAAPGGGKTTLLKRLAISYAFPERRILIDDNLPDRPLIPLFIRCRHLGELTNSPISAILSEISKRAEINELSEAFKQFINSALKSGKALLLVDGLDEISDEGDRISFVKQLRTFLATYPTINIIVTSREAGFRIVGGALTGQCKHYKVSDFDNEDIKRLTIAWHKEVIGDKPEVRSKAKKLAVTICASDRVRQLATNPMLLTTLLLVERWVGQLPTKRSVLYGKAIEVLLMTWNVEGYEPIEQEEAIPQLAFVALTMMKSGEQIISSKRLEEILKLARSQMPEVLGYARLSVSEFVKRVEQRSSLMIFSGHGVEQGTLYPMYEFRHLTFQEYLAARAIVDGYYTDHKETDTLLSTLMPYLSDENWKEVIPLVAVLSGRKVQPLLRHLIEKCKMISLDTKRKKYKVVYALNLLYQCILDEIHIPPDLLKEGLECVAQRLRDLDLDITPIYRGKYGKEMLGIVKEAYISSRENLFILGGTLAHGTLDFDIIKEFQEFLPEQADIITNLLLDKNHIQKASGALAVMHIAFYYCFREDKGIKKVLRSFGNLIVPILYLEENYLHFAACWAFAWLGEGKFWDPKNNPDVISQIFKIWKETKLEDIQSVASWAISSLPIINRKLNTLPEPSPELIAFIKQQSSADINDRGNLRKVLASLIIGYYWKKPWSDDELSGLIPPLYLNSGEDFLLHTKCEEFVKAIG